MGSWLVLASLTALLVWGYWDSLGVLGVYWQSPPYWQGWLVPFVAVSVLLLRRRPAGDATLPARWAGVGLLAASLGARIAASSYGWPLAEMLTFVPALASLWLVVGAWPAFRAGGPAVALLCLMLPLPWAAENAVLDRAQALATRTSTFALQTLGVGAYREGNVINMSEASEGVVGTSSRIRLGGLIVALAAGLALVARRPGWERLVILLSGPPIVLAVNAARLTLTGLFRASDHPAAASSVLRDPGAAGMLSLALVVLALEYCILSRLYRDAPRPEPPLSEAGAAP